MNKVMLIGKLTADPEIRYRPDETPIVNFIDSKKTETETPPLS